jgi:hypothetical protein
MVSIPKIIGVISCGVVLSLSLASATQAFDLTHVRIGKAAPESPAVVKRNSRHPNHQG